jgi:hypothetical protein
MPMFYISICIAIASSSLYHFSQKSTPGSANPAVALLATYVVAIGLTLLLLIFVPAQGRPLAPLGRLNWVRYVLALSTVGLEAGFLLVYRSGCRVLFQRSAGLDQPAGNHCLPGGLGNAQLGEVRV